jgi:hypothetical protein
MLKFDWILSLNEYNVLYEYREQGLPFPRFETKMSNMIQDNTVMLIDELSVKKHEHEVDN